MVEIPRDLYNDEAPEPLSYAPALHTRSGPDPRDVARAAEALVGAQRPVIFAGQGVHYAAAWPQLRELAELLEAPVTTSLPGKSAFPEHHPLSLGSGGHAFSGQLQHFLARADVIFGIGCSFTSTAYDVAMPRDRTIIHATLDPADLAKDVVPRHILVGDAALVLDALLDEVRWRLGGAPRGRRAGVAGAIAQVRTAWLSQWLPKLRSDQTPLTPYRVLWDLLQTVDVANTIITHDAGSPRDQLSPFWVSETPLSYIGWGKTTQLGTGLGLTLGAKLVHPDKLCINVWGDAAIGFTGMDFETAVREHLPILSILFNNFSMAIELKNMRAATEKFRSTDISGNYAGVARELGGYGERVTEPGQIVPAIQRGIEQTRNGVPALLEFITCQETAISTFD
jgi:acetolactate synthase-1/2/3 large subunit